MLHRAIASTLISMFMLASCVTSSSEDSDLQAQTGSGDDDGGGDTGGTGCIEGDCGGSGSGSGTQAACESPATVGDADPAKLGAHDPESFGQRCLDCHDGGAHPELAQQPPQFDFGGRVVDPATGQGRRHALIRLPSTEGSLAVETNDLGYFWWPPAGSYGGPAGGSGNTTEEVTNRATFPAAVGVELNGTLTMMCAEAANGNCASCHDGVTTALIF